MGFFSSVFGGGQKEAAEAAAQAARDSMIERRRATEEAKRQRLAAEGRAGGYMNPYVQYGQQAMPDYRSAINEMQDQPGFLNAILSQYKPSAGYEHQFNEGNRAITQGYAANGLYGSGDYMKALMEHGQNLANQDQQQYLANILGLRGAYMSGLGGMVDQGFNASSNMSNLIGNTGAGIGNDYMRLGEGLAQDHALLGQANGLKQMAKSQMLRNILGTAVSFGAGAMGGGGFSGGFGGAANFLGPQIFGQGMR